MSRIRTKLGTVDAPLAGASVLTPKLPLPAFSGSEDENLLCGACAVVLCRGVSTRTFKTRFGAANQLILTCPKCGAFNVLPSSLG
jgi:hypothetical protein